MAIAHKIKDVKKMKEIENWMVQNKYFGLHLPTAWFGRPYDNAHTITWIADRKYKLLIEIDEQLLLIITKSKHFKIVNENKELLFKNFKHLVFDRLAYGDLEAYTEVYKNGTIRFVSLD